MKLMRDQWENHAPKLFTRIYALSSDYCKLKVQKEENFQAVMNEMNPIKLWKITGKVLVPTAENKTSKFKVEREKLRKIKQCNKSYKDYIAAFEKQLKVYKEVGGEPEGYDVLRYLWMDWTKQKLN